MLLKLVLALIVPALLVILFTRVTYNKYVGLGLALALIVASIYKGYTDYLIVAIVDFVSLGLGFLYATKMGPKPKR